MIKKLTEEQREILALKLRRPNNTRAAYLLFQDAMMFGMSISHTSEKGKLTRIDPTSQEGLDITNKMKNGK